MDTSTFKPIFLPQNKGLGNALREALVNVGNDLVARMDSDDISDNKRFEIQLRKFIKYPDLDIVGGNITEFIGTPENIVTERVVPNKDIDIKKDMRKRCAMNHVTVMYKKESVQSVGGYLDWPYNEDYYLWIRMMEHGCCFQNVSYNLVNVRTGEDMSARRGGWNYFHSEQTLQKYMLNHKLISFPRYLFNVVIRFGGEVIAPNSVRRKLFRYLRKEYKPEKYALNKRKRKRIDSTKKIDYPPFSVAMSVYERDNAEWFDAALKSIINQTVKPNEIILVVDGPVPQAIHSVIDIYTKICASGEKV